MYKIPVSHYSGCGNDFLLIDNRESLYPEFSQTLIRDLCEQKHGANVDGLIVAVHSASADVAMRFYNSDGNEAEMCGNGARCLMQFLRQKRNYPRARCLLETKAKEVLLCSDETQVSVYMGQVQEHGFNIPLEFEGKKYVGHHVNTGVPHLVIFTQDLDNVDVNKVGRAFRFSDAFAPHGVNVNFVEPILHHPDCTAHIRTYERGVERETLACGTGVSAAGYCLHKLQHFHSPINFRVQSGEWLQVLFEEVDGKLDNLVLKGPATWIRDGHIDLNPQSLQFTLHFHEQPVS